MEVINRGEERYPPQLLQLTQKPAQLYVEGHNFAELMKRPRVAIVGSRRISPYGKQITAELSEHLARLGVVIISGLALGVDGLAHRAVLAAGGQCIAVLPTSLVNIAPYDHRPLARHIIESGGALVTEYANHIPTQKFHFVERNRIVAALAQVLLITEAVEKSGSLHTANFALEIGRPVLAVPGNITSNTSAGTNNLLKAGATPVTSYRDVLHTLGLEEQGATAPALHGSTPHEQQIFQLIQKGMAAGDQLLLASKLSVSDFNRALTMLHLEGHIRPLGADNWAPV